jgi:hypothetical protein
MYIPPVILYPEELKNRYSCQVEKRQESSAGFAGSTIE